MLLTSVYNWINRLTLFRIVLVLTLLGLLAYANVVHCPFVHDDVVFIEKNPSIGDLDLKQVFLQAAGSDNNPALINKYYRPLLEAINRILYRIFGPSPQGFHLFNILLHIANGFLVYLIVQLILNRKTLALTAGILFLLHPVQNEAVACISGISNLIFAFLCLLGFYTYLLSMRSADGKRKGLLYGSSLMLFLLGLFAKEQSVILPVLIIAYELCFRRTPIKQTLKECGRFIGGFFIVLAGYFLLRKMLFGFFLLRSVDNQSVLGELWLRMLAVPRSLAVYLGLIFFPHDLHYYRSQDVLLPFLGPLLLMVLVSLIIIGLVYRTPKPQKTWMIFGLAWFIISLGPTLNIVPLINEYSLVLTAEHFLYFPIIGMIFFVMGIWHYWVGQKVKKGASISLILIVAISIVFIGFNIRQNRYWRGEIPLFKRTLQFQKDFGRVRFLLAKTYARAGRYEEAVVEDRKALAIMKGYAGKVQDEEIREFYLGFIRAIHYHLGYCLDILGDTEDALAEFKNALELAPENGAVHYSIGLSYLKLGDLKNAITYFEKSLELNEGDLMVMNSLALCYQKVGQDKKAEQFLRTIVERDPQSASARENLENFLKKKQAAEF